MTNVGPHHLHQTLNESVGKMQVYADVLSHPGVHNAEQWYARASLDDRHRFHRVMDGIRTNAEEPDRQAENQLGGTERNRSANATTPAKTAPSASVPFTIRNDPEIVRSTTNSSQFQFWVPDPKWRAEEKRRIEQNALRLRSSTRGPFTCSEEEDEVWKKRFETSYSQTFSSGKTGSRAPELKKTLFNTSVDDPINQVLLAETYAAPFIKETHHNAMSRLVRDNGEEARNEFADVFHKINNFQRSTENREKFVKRNYRPPSPIQTGAHSSSMADSTPATFADTVRVGKRAEARMMAALPRQPSSTPQLPPVSPQGGGPRTPELRPPWASMGPSAELDKESKLSNYALTYGSVRTQDSKKLVPSNKLHGLTSAATGRVLPNYSEEHPIEISSLRHR